MASSSVATLGSRIAFARKTRGMSQEELAAKARLGVASLCRIEKDKTLPRVSTIFRIAGVLGLHPNAFNDSASLLIEISSAWGMGSQDATRSQTPRTVQPIARWLPLVHVKTLLKWDWEDMDALMAGGPELKTLPASTPGAFVVRAEGPELMGPEVPEGAMIIVEPNLAEETGQYVLASHDNSPVLRKLVLVGEERQLRTLHDGQAPLDLSGARAFPVTGCYKDLVPAKSPSGSMTAKSPPAVKARRK